MRERHHNRGHGRLRRRRRAELASQWPAIVTTVGVGVALPIAAGIPDPDLAFGEHGNEIGVAIAMIAAIGGLFLALAALTGRRLRELVLAGIAFGAAVAHPGIDFVFSSFGENPLGVGRAALGGTAAALAAIYGSPEHRFGRGARTITIGAAAAAVALHVAAELGSTASVAAAATMLLAIACMLGGALAHLRGMHTVDGGLIAVGVLTTSAGLGTALNLVGGRTELTVGVATLTTVSVIIGASAAFMAFLDALERHDVAIDTQRLVRSLELARLTAQSDRHAELAHDQRTSLLAIEAAALRLRDQPSNGLADAVATEAARLQRMLDGADTERGPFTVDHVVTPVVTCLSTLHEPISLEIEGNPHAWGHIDETAEILRALIDNAHEHGRAPVSIDVVDEADEVVVRVHDSGDGVPLALRTVIFDRGVTSDPSSHSGLGLYAARRLARLSGGDLTIATDDAATFELRLPTGPPDTTVIDLTDPTHQPQELRSLDG